MFVLLLWDDFAVIVRDRVDRTHFVLVLTSCLINHFLSFRRSVPKENLKKEHYVMNFTNNPRFVDIETEHTM